LLTIRSSLKGHLVLGWHEITEDDKETKAVMFGMTMSAKMNMATPLLMVKSDEEWTADTMQLYLRTLTQEEFDKFVKEATI
jgi:type VI protein secretion system component Hcp